MCFSGSLSHPMTWKFVAWQVLCAWIKSNCWSLSLFALQKMSLSYISTSTMCCKHLRKCCFQKVASESFNILSTGCALVPQTTGTTFLLFTFILRSSRGLFHRKWGPGRGCFFTKTYKDQKAQWKRALMKKTAAVENTELVNIRLAKSSSGLLQILNFALSEWIPD